MLRNKNENDNFPDKDNYDIKVNKKAKEDSIRDWMRNIKWMINNNIEI